jgi:hypothetical protein
MNDLNLEISQAESFIFICKSGLKVDSRDDRWQLLPNKGKGNNIAVGWLHNSNMSEKEKNIVLDVFINISRTSAASTISGINSSIKPFLSSGIPDLITLKNLWSGLKLNQKKGLNQFFSRLKRLGYKEYNEIHKFTTSNLPKDKEGNHLDPTTGSLTDIENDSLIRNINMKLSTLLIKEDYFDEDYDLSKFSKLKNSISSKLLISIIRRPKQLAILKWCDLIPVGSSFNNKSIDNNISSVGPNSLQLRVFLVKQSKKDQSERSNPESSPIYINENFSNEITKYKLIYIKGIKKLLNSNKIAINESELINLLNNFPIFPSNNIFELKVRDLDEVNKIFTYESIFLHDSEQNLTASFRRNKFISERVSNPKICNNRIRHTVLTRQAQAGLPLPQLAKITGVTIGAVRKYLDMDYSSRKMIDENFIGNEFYRRAFTNPINENNLNINPIYSGEFLTIGSAIKTQNCNNCQTKLAKPIGCYGCNNFNPIIESDHRKILKEAENKLEINTQKLISPTHHPSLEKLRNQIFWIKHTITICDNAKENKLKNNDQ